MFDVTPAHLHLLVNHVPVIGSVAALMLLVWAMIRNNAELKRTALIGFVLVGISAFVADATGDGAAHMIKGLPEIERAKVHEHEEAADYAKMASGVLAAVSLVGLILATRKKDAPGATSADEYARHHHEPNKWIMIIVLLIGLFDLSVLSRVAYLGGAIRHPEIVNGYQAPPAGTAADSHHSEESH